MNEWINKLIIKIDKKKTIEIEYSTYKYVHINIVKYIYYWKMIIDVRFEFDSAIQSENDK